MNRKCDAKLPSVNDLVGSVCGLCVRLSGVGGHQGGIKKGENPPALEKRIIFARYYVMSRRSNIFNLCEKLKKKKIA